MAARQCARRVWLQHYRPELRSRDAGNERRIDQGHELNTIVRRLYPAAQLIPPDLTVDAALVQTTQTLRNDPDATLLEAAFSAAGTIVRADLVQAGKDGLQLTEVKASTRVKAYHVVDAAIQHWVISEAGNRISATRIAHIDKRFIYRGADDYDGLLRLVDVSEQVAELLPAIPGWAAHARHALDQADEPAIAVGAHCSNPRTCPFLDHCRGEEPDFPVRRLPGGGRIVRQLLDEGIDDMRDIPLDRVHKRLQRRVVEATQRGQALCDPALSELLHGLPFPRYFLDFESIQFAIPRWPQTRPFEQIPFQWSCHIEDAEGRLTQREFLDLSGDLPTRACAEALLAACGDAGPIFTYSHFEHSVIGRLAASLPQLAPALHALRARLYDLLPLVRQYYYHPDMRGSFSIKAVLPTVAPDLDYATLDNVHDGVGAQAAFEQLLDPATGSDSRLRIARELRAYCRLDTLAMVRLVQYFCDSASPCRNTSASI